MLPRGDRLLSPLLDKLSPIRRICLATRVPEDGSLKIRDEDFRYGSSEKKNATSRALKSKRNGSGESPSRRFQKVETRRRE